MYDPRTKTIVKTDPNTLWSQFVEHYRHDFAKTHNGSDPSIFAVCSIGAILMLFILLGLESTDAPLGIYAITFSVYIVFVIIIPIIMRPALFIYPLLVFGMLLIYQCCIPKMIAFHCYYCDAIDKFYNQHQKMAKTDLCDFHEYYKKHILNNNPKK